MKILYLSCHSVLEFQELSILNNLDPKLNIEVFSMGAFMNPTQSGDFMRTVIPNGRFYPKLHQVAMQSSQENLHPELLDWADVVFMMHNSAIPGQKYHQSWLLKNWDKMKENRCRVVWRSIGQSTPQIEQELKTYVDRGLRILRYSPLEKNIINFAGEHGMIRFSEDTEEFKEWDGQIEHIVTIAQSFKQRGSHMGFNTWERATDGFRRKVFGTENENLGENSGGQRSYAELKIELRKARAFFYYGTDPAPYTMSFVEAMLTGVPIVAVGKKLRNTRDYPWQQYEVQDIIKNGVNGFLGDNIDDLRGYIELLMGSPERAKKIGDAGRKTAIDLFGRKERIPEWEKFLKAS